MSATHTIRFPDTDFPDIEVEAGTNLSEVLDGANSPVLFGCRTGLCGTCMSLIAPTKGTLTPPSADEQEVIDTVDLGEPDARLACQIDLTADVTIRSIWP